MTDCRRRPLLAILLATLPLWPALSGPTSATPTTAPATAPTVFDTSVTPGQDFGTNGAERHVRFSYTTSLDQIDEGLARMAAYLG